MFDHLLMMIFHLRQILSNDEDVISFHFWIKYIIDDIFLYWCHMFNQVFCWKVIRWAIDLRLDPKLFLNGKLKRDQN